VRIMTTPARVLIVDDESNGREVLEGMLAGENLDLQFAASGAEALRMAMAHAPDLVLLDVMMPGLNGFEVCRRLRDEPRLRELPVILVTALDDRDSRLKGLEAGADDFVSKPFDRLELRTRVRTIVRLNRYRSLVEERARVAQSYEHVLDGWMHVLDLRDHGTRGHTRRVTSLAVALAQAADLSPNECEMVRRGALLHDIGKIGIPDSILHKPGPLTAEEWRIMRRHPEHARDLLAPIPFLQSAIAIPYCHHEWWNGHGYPRGLAGESIPYAARLFAVVDAYDALVSARPYKPSCSHEDALARIQSSAGTHFDPAVVDLFVRLMSERGSGAPPYDTVMARGDLTRRAPGAA
jgi:putative two-component system response regulator